MSLRAYLLEVRRLELAARLSYAVYLLTDPVAIAIIRRTLARDT